MVTFNNIVRCKCNLGQDTRHGNLRTGHRSGSFPLLLNYHHPKFVLGIDSNLEAFIKLLNRFFGRNMVQCSILIPEIFTVWSMRGLRGTHWVELLWLPLYFWLWKVLSFLGSIQRANILFLKRNLAHCILNQVTWRKSLASLWNLLSKTGSQRMRDYEPKGAGIQFYNFQGILTVFSAKQDGYNCFLILWFVFRVKEGSWFLGWFS